MRAFALLLALTATAAQAENIVYGSSSTGPQPFAVNSSGQASITLLAGEDQTNGVMKVEHQYSKCVATADTQCKAAAGYLHSITCFGVDAAAQAGGTILVYDNPAETGTSLYGVTPAAAAFTPVGAVMDVPLASGLYIGFPAGATDVACVASFR